METFVASRLAGGNRAFPSKLIIDDKGVTLKIPGLFGGKERTIPFTSISNVDIDCPFVGYSTIIIASKGDGEIIASGFAKADVIRMRELILNKT